MTPHRRLGLSFFLRLLAGGVFAVVIGPTSALAAVVTVSDNILLVLPSDGSVYTIASGSTFDQLDMNGGTFTFTMTAGESVTITAPDTRDLMNNGGFVYTCGSQTSLTIPASGSIVVSVIPTAGGNTRCSYSAGAGGSSVSNVIAANPVAPVAVAATTTSVSTATTTSPSVLTTNTQPSSAIVTPSTTVSGTPAGTASSGQKSFRRALSLGMSGDDVLQLQKLLSQYHSVYPEGKLTGYFGGLTKQAVVRFQRKYNLSPVGVVGPLTRDILNKMLVQ